MIIQPLREVFLQLVRRFPLKGSVGVDSNVNLVDFTESTHGGEGK